MTPHTTACLVLLAACSGDPSGQPGGNGAGAGEDVPPPVVAFSTLTDGQVVPRGADWSIQAEVRTPGSELADLLWVSSREGVLVGDVDWSDQVATFTLAEDLAAGDHALTVWAITTHGGTAAGRVRVSVMESDLDGDGDISTRFGGGDCDDTDPSVNVWATDDCDGVDNDCDGVVDDAVPSDPWYPDEDGDSYGARAEPVFSCSEVADHARNRSDCDDADPTRRRCRSCAHALEEGRTTDDEPTPIEPTSGAPFYVTCEQTAHDGGWTLVATNAWDGAWDAGWGPMFVMDDVPFGLGLSLEDSTKSRAFSEVPFTDVLFENGVEHVRYDGVGDGTLDWQRFAAGVPSPNCGTESSWTWPAAESTLTAEGLCGTELTLHPIHRPSGPACDGDDWGDAGFGPTWSVALDSGCPLDQPQGTGFFGDAMGHNPWGTATPLHMWVR
jgi:hypothetical protein